MSAPENTRNRDNLTHLLGIMGEGQSEYITGQEAAGQAQLLTSDVLPADAPWADRPDPDQYRRRGTTTLEDLGFVKGDPVPDDDLFVHCTLPAGWTRQGSDHAMWSYICDERGVERIGVFYKAAFYDRGAHAHVIDVGADLGGRAVYGDGEPALPPLWDQLTADERAGYRAYLDRYLAEAEECPRVYADRLPRVRALVALVQAAA